MESVPLKHERQWIEMSPNFAITVEEAPTACLRGVNSAFSEQKQELVDKPNSGEEFLGLSGVDSRTPSVHSSSHSPKDGAGKLGRESLPFASPGSWPISHSSKDSLPIDPEKEEEKTSSTESSRNFEPKSNISELQQPGEEEKVPMRGTETREPKSRPSLKKDLATPTHAKESQPHSMMFDFEKRLSLRLLRLQINSWMGFLAESRTELEQAIPLFENAGENAIACAVHEDLKTVNDAIAAANEILVDCERLHDELMDDDEELKRMETSPDDVDFAISQAPLEFPEETVHDFVLFGDHRKAQYLVRLNSLRHNVRIQLSRFSHSGQRTMPRSTEDTHRMMEAASMQRILYLKVPQDERRRICAYLFEQETCPHRDYVPFVVRLHLSKHKKGEGRKWTCDEHELLHIIREITLELMDNPESERKRQALIRAADSLFDALEDDISNYCSDKSAT